MPVWQHGVGTFSSMLPGRRISHSPVTHFGKFGRMNRATYGNPGLASEQPAPCRATDPITWRETVKNWTVRKLRHAPFSGVGCWIWMMCMSLILRSCCPCVQGAFQASGPAHSIIHQSQERFHHNIPSQLKKLGSLQFWSTIRIRPSSLLPSGLAACIMSTSVVCWSPFACIKRAYFRNKR